MRNKNNDNKNHLLKKIKLLEKLSINGIKFVKIRNKDNFRNRAKRKIKGSGTCVICGEDRCVEVCHIIPVNICRDVFQFRRFAGDKNNCLFLCRNHHWMFDKKKLRDDELEKIYISKLKFIEEDLLDVANSSIRATPGCNVSATDYNNIDKFIDWISWVSRVFYKQND